MEDLLEHGNQLLPDLGRGGRKDGQKPFPKPLLLILRYWLMLRSVLTRRPASGNAVFEVDNRCSLALVLLRAG